MSYPNPPTITSGPHPQTTDPTELNSTLPSPDLEPNKRLSIYGGETSIDERTNDPAFSPGFEPPFTFKLNHRTPTRPNASRTFAPIPSFQPPITATLRNRLISVSPTEFIFQTYHEISHIFSGTNDTLRMLLEIRQEEVILTPGEEFQYRVRLNPFHQQTTFSRA